MKLYRDIVIGFVMLKDIHNPDSITMVPFDIGSGDVAGYQEMFSCGAGLEVIGVIPAPPGTYRVGAKIDGEFQILGVEIPGWETHLWENDIPLKDRG